MATYTVAGHPLNYADIPESVRAAVMTLSVGQTFVATLPAPDDTKVKGHAVLK